MTKQMNEWIPITERLPENESRVLMSVRPGLITNDSETMTHQVFMGCFYNDEGPFPHFVPDDCPLGTKLTFEVSAWMPVPEPYITEEEEDDE